MKALNILKKIKENNRVRFLDETIDEAIKELENISSLQSHMSCESCLYNSFCGVYAYLKSIKSEDKPVDAFSCNNYTKDK